MMENKSAIPISFMNYALASISFLFNWSILLQFWLGLRFSSPQARVGAFVTGDAGTTITLEVYGVGDVLLETVSTAAVPIGQWIDNFLGIERNEGIVRIVFRGHDFGVDALLFSDTFLQAIPEPGSALLVGLGLALLASRRWLAAPQP